MQQQPFIRLGISHGNEQGNPQTTIKITAVLLRVIPVTNNQLLSILSRAFHNQIMYQENAHLEGAYLDAQNASTDLQTLLSGNFCRLSA